jgi:hypothetical protein
MSDKPVSNAANVDPGANVDAGEMTNTYLEFDRAKMFAFNRQAERVQVSQAEMTWLQHYSKPDRPADVVLSMGCGMQMTPHLMMVLVTLFRQLDIDFVATAGSNFCCGMTYQRPGKEFGQSERGNRIATTSIRRFASWAPTTTVQPCGSCFVEFSRQVDLMRAEGQAPFEVVHLTRFLLDALRRLGDKVPWQQPVPRRVMLHAEGAEVHASKEIQRNEVISTLELVPGVEFVGLVEDPSAGQPCVFKPGTRDSVLSGLTPAEYRHVLAELRTQADAVGADAILTHHHVCHREWSKFSTRRLPVIYYPALLTEALGVTIPDRFQMLWNLRDPKRILEETRVWWSSWGISESEANEIVHKLFVPAYSSAIQTCPCEGSCLTKPLENSAPPADACTAATGLIAGSAA